MPAHQSLIYLDHNATTPIDPGVREAMLPCFVDAALAKQVLRVGKTINFVRFACADTQWAVSLPKQGPLARAAWGGGRPLDDPLLGGRPCSCQSMKAATPGKLSMNRFARAKFGHLSVILAGADSFSTGAGTADVSSSSHGRQLAKLKS